MNLDNVRMVDVDIPSVGHAYLYHLQDCVANDEDVFGGGFAVVDDEVSVDFGDGSVADGLSFQPEGVDQFACGNFLGVFERAASGCGDGLGVFAFVAGFLPTLFDVFVGIVFAFENGLESEVAAELLDVAIVGNDLIAFASADDSVFIEEGDTDDLIKGFDAHRSGVHTQGTSDVSWDAFHPLEATDAVSAGEGGEFF